MLPVPERNMPYALGEAPGSAEALCMLKRDSLYLLLSTLSKEGTQQSLAPCLWCESIPTTALSHSPVLRRHRESWTGVTLQARGGCVTGQMRSQG